MSFPSVSVITAVRNGRTSIADTLRSVANQTYGAKEHIVQDGVSVDGTQQVVRELGIESVMFVSEPDTGVYDAFNRGLRRASGDVIAFLGADDVYFSNDVLAQVADGFRNDRLEVLFGDVVFVRPDDSPSVIRYYRSAHFRPNRLRRGSMPAHPATFVRRSVFERYGEFDPSYRIAGDFEWFARVFGRIPPAWQHVPEVLVKMRLGGLSTAGPRATWLITNEMRRACRANGIATGYLSLLSRLPGKVAELVRR